MPRSVAEIQAEIARVKQEIAARDMYRQPQTQVGWGSYIVDGDRGMLDAYQNREDQYNKMMKQQAFQAAEAALNRKFQEQENERNRQNAIKLALANKSLANDEKLDDYMRLRAKAATTLSFAKQKLDATPKENKAEYEAAARDVALAQHDLDYYNKKVGYKEPTQVIANDEPEAPKAESRDDSKSVPVKLTDSKAIKHFKTEAERKAQVKKLEDMDPEGQNKEIQEEIVRLNNLGSDELRQAELNSANEQFLKTGKFDTNKFKIKYSNGKATLVRK